MSKICKNCGGSLDDNAAFCFKCKHHPDKPWTPEAEKKAVSNEKKKKTVSTVITIIVTALLIVGIVFIIRGCTDIHREIKVGDGSVKLTSVSREKAQDRDGDAITLEFHVKGNIRQIDIQEFVAKIEIGGHADASFDIEYYSDVWSSEGGFDGPISDFKAIFYGFDSNQKITEGDIRL